jgi:hypothetical protein
MTVVGGDMSCAERLQGWDAAPMRGDAPGEGRQGHHHMRHRASKLGTAPGDFGRGADRRLPCKNRHPALSAAKLAIPSQHMIMQGTFFTH